MDLTTLIDIISIHSGQLPIHIIHPSLGMFFVYYVTEKFLALFSLSNTLSYDVLKNSLEPMLVIANKIYFLRLVNSVIVISIPAILVTSLYNINRKIPFLIASVFFIYSINFMEWNLHRIRTENFSIFFLSIGSALASYALFSKKENIVNYILVLSFLSFAYTTKIQALFLVISIFTILCFYYPISDTVKIRLSSKELSKTILIIYLSVCIVAFLYSYPVANAARGHFFNHLIGMPSLLLLFYYSRKNNIFRSKFINNILEYIKPHFIILFITFVLSIAFFSSMGVFSGNFWNYFITFFKTIFLKFSIYDIPLSKEFKGNQSIYFKLKHYWPYLVPSLLLFFTNSYFLKIKQRKKDWMCYLLVTIFLFLNLITSRSFINDTIWNYIFLSFYILASYRVLETITNKRIIRHSYIILIIISSLFVFNRNMLTKTSRYIHTMTLDYKNFFKPFYPLKRAELYSKTLSKFYLTKQHKMSVKKRLEQPFKYFLYMKSIFFNENLSINDISFPYNNSFLIRTKTNKKQKIDCIGYFCENSMFVISLLHINNFVEIRSRNDVDLFLLRKKKLGMFMCGEILMSETQGLYIYKLNCSNDKFIKYNLDRDSIALSLKLK